MGMHQNVGADKRQSNAQNKGTYQRRGHAPKQGCLSVSWECTKNKGTYQRRGRAAIQDQVELRLGSVCHDNNCTNV